ncbi:unnamed protein product [Cunninghamella echinulata]
MQPYSFFSYYFPRIKYNKLNYKKPFLRFYSQECLSIHNHEKRIPKKKVALLFGFNGSGYQGLQFNPNIQSIEQELYTAIYKAGLISTSNATDPKKVKWGRAARTDKGVHAVGNVISLKLMINEEEKINIAQRINNYLPPQIRVWGYISTTKSFHAKNQCDSRKYEYLLPTYTLMPINQYYQEQQQLNQYRIPTTQFNQFQHIMNQFIGTHYFHNYTIGKNMNQMACQRYVKNIIVNKPTIQFDGLEWVLISLHGQSFMLHQIRKMIAMAIFMTRSDTPASLIDQTFQHGKLNIPKAPSLGLLLDRPIYDWYNTVKIKDHVHNRHPINFDLYQDVMDDFKQKWIYESIFKTEAEESIYDDFLQTFDRHYPIDPELGYINKEGIIPSSCYVVKREKNQLIT